MAEPAEDVYKRQAQNTFYDCQCNIPLMIKPAAGTAIKPRVTEALAELADIPATVAEMAGFSLDYTQFGRSLCPVLEGGEQHKDCLLYTSQLELWKTSSPPLLFTALHKAQFCEQ